MGKKEKTVKELKKNQINELKQLYLIEAADSGRYMELTGKMRHRPTDGDFRDVDEIVSDGVIFEKYKNRKFTDNDFFCTWKH